MSSYVLFDKSGSILGANSGSSNIDTSNLLTKTVADVTFLNEVGDTLRGNLDFNGYKIINIGAPSAPNDVVRKQDAVTTSGAIFTGDINMGGYKIFNYGSVSEYDRITQQVTATT